MSNPVYDALLALIPGRQHITPSGWISFNAVCCPHVGAHRLDTRKRAGITLAGQRVRYHCHNCGYATSWESPQTLSRRMKDLMGWMGATDEQITKLNYEVWRISKQAFSLPPIKIIKQPPPNGAKRIFDWVDEDCRDPNFIDVLADLQDLSADRLKDIYWTPDPGQSGDMNRRFIDVVEEDDEIIGWTACVIGDASETEPLLSDRNILAYMAEQEESE